SAGLTRKRLSPRDHFMTLSQCDRKQVAVVLPVSGSSRILRGQATYVPDPNLGYCLRIVPDDPDEAGLELLFQESSWLGEIASGEKYGCDFMIAMDDQRRSS
ncbi:MAG TPA: hypothetical protein VMP01_26340, partial [Pirellulaceae bacterium]|nr:hypothetical protein [Pirellulaceae bacterium]